MLRFKYRREVEKELSRDPEMIQALMPTGREIASAARQNSPMAKAEPGRYGKIEVRAETDRVTVTTAGSFAHIDEWGGKNSPAHASMRRAAARVGKFREAGR